MKTKKEYVEVLIAIGENLCFSTLPRELIGLPLEDRIRVIEVDTIIWVQDDGGTELGPRFYCQKGPLVWTYNGSYLSQQHKPEESNDNQ